MVPTLALLFCTLFVAFLLRLDRLQSRKVSLLSWVPTIWMLIAASRPLGVWFGQSGDIDAGSPLDQYGQLALLGLGMLTLARRPGGVSRSLRENSPLVFLLCYMFISVLWSDIPFTSFKRWTRELIACVMALLLLTESEPRQAMLSILRRTAYILIPFSVLLVKYYPQYGVEYGNTSGVQMWTGVTLQKNGLGRLCMIAAFFLVWTLVRRKQGRDAPARKYLTAADVTVLVMALGLLSGPGNQYSATAFVSLAAGIALLGILYWHKKRRAVVGVRVVAVACVALIVLGILQPIIGGAAITGFTSSVGREETLTGRTEVWAGLLPVVWQNPFLGSGIGGFWTIATRVQHRIGEAHSGYLDVLLDLGFVGLLVVSFFVLTSCLRAREELRRDFDWGVLWLCLLLMSLIHNITETSLVSLTCHLTAVLACIAITSAGTTPLVAVRELRGLAGTKNGGRSLISAGRFPGTPEGRP